MNSGYSNFTQTTPGNGTLMNLLFYGLLIAFAAVIILVIIHFTYKPIFGTAGGLLSGDAGTVKWEDELSSTHEDVSSNICDTVYYNYSLCFDMIIDTTFTSSVNQTILQQVSASNSSSVPNFQFYLDASKNDLIFQVPTSDNNNSYIVLTNMPIRKEFTIGFILSDKFMEAYVNGALYKTQVFPAPIRLKENLSKDLVYRDGLKGSNAPPVRMKRLRLWGSIVAPDVMRAYASAVSPSFKLESENVAEGTCGA